ncbi:MAG: XdhC family protein [Anaerolineae bacterium]|nr:XdhC family protein [Anaerolineae bacterium]
MRELLPTIEKWKQEGKQIALATIVQAYGSAPRPLGSKMVISSTGDFAGSVSGGCIEGAVIEEALNVMKTGVPKLLDYGISNNQAWDIGLACGGSVQVYVEALNW